ncbi:MAG: nickel/cobalt transporter [Hyphomicrobiales bacterium]
MHIKKYLVAVAISGLFVLPAFGQSPFGVGTPAPTAIPTDGIFADFFRWVIAQQSAFYQQLTGSVREMKETGSAFWTLISLSFLYGVFHAAGPGHGKVVMSSYVLANHETARRGALLCLLSSLLQAMVAIVLIGILAIVFNATSLVISETTKLLETASYALIVVLGVLLTIRAARALMPAKSLHHHHSHEHHGHSHSDDHHHHHDHHDECGCGHAHAPSPEMVNKAAGGVKAAFAAILSVGLRPCTGALIVLVFALAQGLFWAGVLSALAMGVGTAITVTTLMFFAVGTRQATLSFAGSNVRLAGWMLNLVQLLGAVAVLVLGLILLTASLQIF